MHTHVYVGVCLGYAFMQACTEKPEADVRQLSQLHSTLFYEAGLLSELEFTNEARLATQQAQESACFCFSSAGLQVHISAGDQT